MKTRIKKTIFEKFKATNWKDVGIRAMKTFIQAFIAAISVSELVGITDVGTLKATLASMAIAGLSAGVSAAWNVLQGVLDGVFSSDGDTEES